MTFTLRHFIWTLVSSVLLITFAASASAHEIRPAVADVSVSATELRLEIELTIESLLAGIDSAAFEDTNDAPQAEDYDRFRALSPEEIEAEVTADWDRLKGYFVATGDGADPNWQLVSIEVPAVGDIELPRDTKLTLASDLMAGGPVAVGGRADLGPLILRHVNAGDDAFEGLLSPGQLSPPLPRQGGASETAMQTFVRYIVLGVEHIVPKGLDHILFVLGLFFFSLAWRPLLWQVTTFTLAHTVTLALASLQIVTLPASVVEPLIAASIVYVAVENVFSDGRLSRWRTLIVFLFGLLHGLGFASVLGEIGLGQGRFVVSLIGFNIGVELGQLIVIAAAFALVGYLFGQKPYYRKLIAVPASIAIGLVGAYWVIERVFL